MKDKNWSYLAGIFDGEGTVCIENWERTALDGRGAGPYTYKQHTLVISVKNTFLPLIRWLIKHFGGVYYTQSPDNPRHKLQYVWRPKGKKNKENFLLGVLPYLIVKREQALIGLEYLRLPAGRNSATRTALAERCSLLNQNGESVTTNTLDTKVKIESDLHSDMQSAPVVTQTA